MSKFSCQKMDSNNAEELRNSLLDISLCMGNLKATEKVTCMAWTLKLTALPEDELKTLKLKCQYARMLKIYAQNGSLNKPFESFPPEEPLSPWKTYSENTICKEIPVLPRIAPSSPAMCLYRPSPERNPDYDRSDESIYGTPNESLDENQHESSEDSLYESLAENSNDTLDEITLSAIESEILEEIPRFRDLIRILATLWIASTIVFYIFLPKAA